MERLTGRSRRIYLHWRSSGTTNEEMSLAPPSFVAGTVIPASFSGVHPALCQYVEDIKLAPQVPSLESAIHNWQPLGNQSQNSWLPDIYHFASNGIGIDERYERFPIAITQPTPFIPSSPRVDENDEFNFDYGALTAELEDTSYMAWF